MFLARSVAVVLAACACVPAGVNAAQTVKLRAAFHPDAPGQRTTIKLGLRITGPGGGAPSPVTSFDLRLPLNMGIATTTLGEDNCEPAALIESGVEGCPGNARLGYGTASAVVPLGTESVQETASLDALMGPPARNRIEVLWYVQASQPVSAQLVLPSVVGEAAPPYGEQLATSVPLVPTWPEGPDLALETFDSTIGPAGLLYHHKVAGKTVAFHPRGIRIPRVCPAGGYGFQALVSFQDGTQTSTAYRVPCPGH